MEYLTYNNGFQMPLVGLGVFRIGDEEMDRVVAQSYELGYRHYDTAQMYHNEAALGRALANLGVARQDFILTTKIDNLNQGYEQTLKSFGESCKKLRVDYVDQVLIHWPGQDPKRTAETWRALEKLYDEGLVKAIGLSNFTLRHIAILEKTGNIQPMSNQIERNPAYNQLSLLPILKDKDIVPIAWAPLRRGDLDQPILKNLARKYGKTPAQVALRWNLDSGVVVIPKSVNPDRLAENIDIFDFSLTAEDINQINGLQTGVRTSFDPETFDF